MNTALQVLPELLKFASQTTVSQAINALRTIGESYDAAAAAERWSDPIEVMGLKERLGLADLATINQMGNAEALVFIVIADTEVQVKNMGTVTTGGRLVAQGMITLSDGAGIRFIQRLGSVFTLTGASKRS